MRRFVRPASNRYTDINRIIQPFATDPPGTVHVETRNSNEGRDIWLATVTSRAKFPPNKNPGILVEETFTRSKSRVPASFFT